MSGIRTLLDLQEAMSREIGWRRKELHSLKGIVIEGQRRRNIDIHIRSAVPLLYAHWEGFVKATGGYYLEFVGRKKLPHGELSQHFLAAAVARFVPHGGAEHKAQRCLEIVRFFESEMPKGSSLAWKSGINTKANLNSDVLREIVLTLGLDYSRFATKENLLDEKLLGNRNRIAHGQYLLVDFEEYIALHDDVLLMMLDFYDQVENAALLGAYRKTPVSAAP
jgi:hypothetical protein